MFITWKIYFVLILGLLFGVSANIENNSLFDDCKDNVEFNVLCQSARVMRNVIKSLKDTNSPLVLMPGLEIVSVKDNKDLTFDARSNSIDEESKVPITFSGRLNKYLRNHELKIKFSDLMDKNDFKETFGKFLKNFDDPKEVQEGRKKDKGLGIVMIMGLMMAKMMAALGLGGIGAMAMKALGVSMIALLLSGIIGLKTLTSGNHEEGGHHVQYITAHEGHHRKRRDIVHDTYGSFPKTLNQGEKSSNVPLPYRAWKQYYSLNH